MKERVTAFGQIPRGVGGGRICPAKAVKGKSEMMKKLTFKRWQMKKLLLWFIAVVFLGGGYICYATVCTMIKCTGTGLSKIRLSTAATTS